MAKKGNKKNKHDLPVFDSDTDLIRAFEKKDAQKMPGHDARRSVLRDPPKTGSEHEKKEEDFSRLLEEYFRHTRPFRRKPVQPVPVKKRLKRYPPVEIELDLHGYTAIGAQLKTKSFLSSAKQQGFFTARIIVGKGLHSDLGPVLPDAVEDTLNEMKRQGTVLAYRWEKKKKSASGAAIVFLKQFDEFD